jgi:2-keto-3-deoxy-L-rhamnonate aldolase RhmA
LCQATSPGGYDADRVPDATDIQKATDIGALGIIVPTVDTVEKAEAAVKWSRDSPQGAPSAERGTGVAPIEGQERR